MQISILPFAAKGRKNAKYRFFVLLHSPKMRKRWKLSLFCSDKTKWHKQATIGKVLLFLDRNWIGHWGPEIICFRQSECDWWRIARSPICECGFYFGYKWDKSLTTNSIEKRCLGRNLVIGGSFNNWYCLKINLSSATRSVSPVTTIDIN